LLIERSPLANIENPTEDGREIALTHLSVKLMQQLGAWERIDPDAISPIKTAKVINGNSNYSLDFTRPSKTLEALGYLIPNHLIRKAFYDEVATFDNIKLLTNRSVTDLETNDTSGIITLSSGETLTSTLIVAADSRFSETRRKMGISTTMQDFSRTAIVCRMTHELSHQQTAFECFHYGKTMALLPMTGNLSSVVITISNQKAGSILAMSDELFNQQVQQWFGNKLGKISLTGKRHSYPLIAVHANKFISNRYAVIGDASVGMHPVTAHGFNLGLRGADTLAKEIKKASIRGKNIGSYTVLKKYERKHMRITKFLYHGTNHIVGLFTNETQPAKLIRTTALRIANNFPPIRHLITAKLTETGHTNLLPPLPSFPFPFKKSSNRKNYQ
jgi:ubiquinone biosynthesis UbiH/UbiF/VisC/COQ6 family hydroxylase